MSLRLSVILIIMTSAVVAKVNNDALMCFISQLYPLELQKVVFNKIDKLVSATQDSTVLSSKVRLTQEVQHQIATILTHFDSLNPKTQQAFIDCRISTAPTKLRCEEVYGVGNCEAINAFTYSKKCPEGFVRHDQFFCFPKCPALFVEQGSSCLKPEAKLQQYYDSAVSCRAANGNEKCINDANGLWLPDCGADYERVLTFLCVPKCPIQFLETATACHKSERIESGEVFLFNIQDLIFG